ncbi:hypothetical protein Airi02_069150 [Actinoallomurus iriomotensis]|uniref:Uncharacterized protein n=1 Tax=Actinoallomurus iriomotensis TaxID=478107 RepID=A0A9W6W4G9_9ACTN|nr:hypothetical protein Airi02_069150 [Actinoallomurus iriomotensis]
MPCPGHCLRGPQTDGADRRAYEGRLHTTVTGQRRTGQTTDGTCKADLLYPAGPRRMILYHSWNLLSEEGIAALGVFNERVERRS